MSGGRAVTVHPLTEADLDGADRIFRVAFGTFLGVPDPEHFFGDVDVIRTRWRADPGAGLGAESGGNLIGSSFAANWGSVGILGPLTVSPSHWDRGVGRRLLDSTMEIFEAWKTQRIGLFTFAHSPKHVGLYQRYGFWPRSLTAIMSRPVDPVSGPVGLRLSAVPDNQRADVLRSIRDLAGAVYPGLDVSNEIESVLAQGLGDTVLLDDNGDLQAIAVCHIGAGSEAGSGSCYVKFGAVRPGPDAARVFSRLIDACNGLAAATGAAVLMAGANAARERAWGMLTDRGFRAAIQGVAMQRPNDAGYCTGESYVIDDWR